MDAKSFNGTMVVGGLIWMSTCSVLYALVAPHSMYGLNDICLLNRSLLKDTSLMLLFPFYIHLKVIRPMVIAPGLRLHDVPPVNRSNSV